MRQINHASLPAGSGDEGALKRIQTSLQGVMKFGPGDVHLQAQEALAEQLGRVLDNHYVMLRNFVLEPGTPPIPIILFAPSGLWVINTRGEEGLYKAEGEEWLEMNKRTQQYQPAPKNVIRQTLEFSRLVRQFVDSLGDSFPAPQPILFFGHPGAHIDAIQPAVRIVRMDGIDRLYGLIISGKPVMDSVQIQKAVDAMVKMSEEKRQQKVEVKPTEKSEFWQEGENKDTKPDVTKSVSAFDLPPALKKFRLTSQQWVILAIMVAFEILLLIVFILFVIYIA